MCHTLSGLSTYLLDVLREGDEIPAYAHGRLGTGCVFLTVASLFESG